MSGMATVERIALEGGADDLDAQVLVRADLLEASLAHLDGQIDLVYFDPPFGTGDRFEAEVDVDGARLRVPAYDDAWEDGLDGLLAFIEPRLVRIHTLLGEEGSFFLHADHRATPYLAVICDRIFGRGDREGTGRRPGFRNEIIWRYGLGGSSARCYPKKHDVLLWYTKGERWWFEAPRVPATSRRMAGLDKKCPDVWDIPSLNNMAKERNGYPTQKPEALLERIVKAHTRPGARVLDPGFGSGTSAAVAHALDRRYVGLDPSPLAFHRTRVRIAALGASSAAGQVACVATPVIGEDAHARFALSGGALTLTSVHLPPDGRVAAAPTWQTAVAAVESVYTLGEDAVSRRAPPHERAVVGARTTARIVDVLGRAFTFRGATDDLLAPDGVALTRTF